MDKMESCPHEEGMAGIVPSQAEARTTLPLQLRSHLLKQLLGGKDALRL